MGFRQSIHSSPAAPRKVIDRGGRGLDLRAFGVPTDGTTSAADALEAAIAAVPDFDAAWSTIGRPAGGATLWVPTLDNPARPFVIDRPITIPATKAIVLAGNGPQMARFTLTGAGGFIVAGAQRPTAFEGLVFDCQGTASPITYQDDNRLYHAVRDCLFNGAQAPAISIGAGVVNLAIHRCFFSQCAGGVWVTGTSSDGIYVDYCSFVRGTDIDVKFAGFDCRVRWCDFESRNTSFRSKPFINLLNSYNRVEDCRIEGDSGTGLGSPTNSIAIGPADGTTSDTALSGIIVTGNRFGRVEAAAADVADAWIKLTVPLHNAKIDHNLERLPPYSAFVDDYYTANGAAPENHGDNTFANNTRYYLRSTPAFKNGGAGFQGFADDGRDLLRRAAPERAGGNLLKDTNDLSTARWTRASGITVAKDATGPDGVASSAHTITKAGTSGSLNSAATAAIVGTTLVASAYVKAGSINRCRLAIRDQTAGAFVTPNVRAFLLTDEWQRISIVAPKVTAGHTYALYLFAGHNTDTAATTGTILAYGPQLEEGTTPSPYHEAPSNTVRAARQFQALPLGTNVVGYGTAAPTTGYYLAGDVVVNVAPTGTTPFAWQCIAAGTPGTWVGCGTPSDIATVARLVEDFLFGTSGAWTGDASAWGTASNTAGHPGRARLTSTSVAGTLKAGYPKTATSGIFEVNSLWEMTFLVAAQQANTDADAEWALGWTVDAGSRTPANGCYFRRTASQTTWRAVTRAGGTETETDTTVTQDTSYHRFRVRRFLDAANANAPTIGFSIDGGAETKITTNIPANGTFGTPFLHAYNGAAAAAKQLDVDYIALVVLGLSR